MKLGLQLGYWAAEAPSDHLEKVVEAEKLGYDIVFTAESWGSDAYTPLAWWGSRTSTIRLGTSVVQMSGRTPTSTAMHALTLDHLSGGRHVLGLGFGDAEVELFGARVDHVDHGVRDRLDPLAADEEAIGVAHRC